jgi:hypothetical protein
MSDRDAVLFILRAIPGKKVVTVDGFKFTLDKPNPTVDKRLVKLLEKLDVPIEITISRQLDDTYLNEKGKVKRWLVIYGLLLDDIKIEVITDEYLRSRHKKADGVVFETLDLHALVADQLAKAGGQIGEAASDAYKANLKIGDFDGALNAAVDAAYDTVKRIINE